MLVVAAGFAAYYVYDRIADQIAGADLVSVPFVEGKLQSLDVPEGFPGGPFRPTFVTERACANR